MNNFQKIKIDLQENGKRLDKFLTEKFPDFSRSYWQKQIKNQDILINKKPTTSRYKIKTEDILEIEKSVFKKVKDKNLLEADKSIHFEILFENEDYLIINKPSGLVVHPHESVFKKTLVNGLLYYYPKIKNVGEDLNRPGIVHRLDKDVSGLMLIAKNQKSFLHFKEQFKKRKVKKEYLSLAHGQILKDEWKIELKIGRHKKTGLMKVGDKENYKTAITKIEVLKRFRNFTFLKVKILTGRTHQIRVHLKAIDHPVAGDNLYFSKKYLKFLPNDLKRIFLHSYKLGFFDLDNQWQEFEKDLPDDLKMILNNLS